MTARQVRKIKKQIGTKYKRYFVSRRCERNGQYVLAEDEYKAVRKYIHRFLYRYKMYPSDYIPGCSIRMQRQDIAAYKVVTPDGFTFYYGQ